MSRRCWEQEGNYFLGLRESGEGEENCIGMQSRTIMRQLVEGGRYCRTIKPLRTEPSNTLSSALVLEHHHPILSMLWSHVGRLYIYIYIYDDDTVDTEVSLFIFMPAYTDSRFK